EKFGLPGHQRLDVADATDTRFKTCRAISLLDHQIKQLPASAAVVEATDALLDPRFEKLHEGRPGQMSKAHHVEHPRLGDAVPKPRDQPRGPLETLGHRSEPKHVARFLLPPAASGLFHRYHEGESIRIDIRVRIRKGREVNLATPVGKTTFPNAG